MPKVIWKIPVPSTALLTEPEFSMLSKRKCLIEYSYEGQEYNSTTSEKLIFDGVESFKCTYYKACSTEMIDAYDKLVDVENSFWLNEVKQNLSKSGCDPSDLKHLRIYYDDGPCYEFICKSFEIVNEFKKEYFEN